MDKKNNCNKCEKEMIVRYSDLELADKILSEEKKIICIECASTYDFKAV
jgi:hypothetical protein